MAVNDHCVFLWDNYWDDAVLAASSEEATLPAELTQDQIRTFVWQSTGCTSEYLRAALTAVEVIDAVAITNCNLSGEGQIRLTLSSDNTYAGDLYDSGWLDAVECIYGFGDGGFGVSGFGGQPLEADLEDYPGLIFTHFLPEGVESGFVDIQFADPTNTDGYLQAGRVFVTSALVPSRNVMPGWEWTPADDSKIDYSDGGVAHSDTDPQRTDLAFQFPVVDDAERFAEFGVMFRRCGVRRDLIVCLTPDDAPVKAQTTIYGRFVKVPTLSNVYTDLNQFGKINFRESL